MKVLFLDFDGVLHPSSPGIDPLFSRAPLLEEALINHEIPIVISSSWRFTHSLKQLKDKLPKKLANMVIDVTGKAIIGKYPRHTEILNYLNNSNEYSSWRSLDDSYWEFPSSCKELIRCNPNSGIGSREVKLLTEWLNS